MDQTPTEAELMKGIRNHHTDTLEFLYRRYFPIVAGYVNKNSGNDEDAKDAFQDGMIALWSNINAGKYESRGDKGVAAYLVQICKFRWLEKLKSAGHKYSSAWDADWTGSDEEHRLANMIKDEEINYAVVLVARLGERCQRILKAFYYEKQKLTTIAAMLSISPESAKNEKYRCMQKLKELHLTNKTFAR